MRNETVMRQLDWIESNVAWSWQIEQLQGQIDTLKKILVKAGILENVKEYNEENLYLINNETYVIKRERNNANT